MKSFIDRVLGGEADVSKVDDFVDRWHEGEGSESLAAFLGMSEDEYALWAQKPHAGLRWRQSGLQPFALPIEISRQSRKMGFRATMALPLKAE